MRNPFAYIFIWLFELSERWWSQGLDQYKEGTPNLTATRFKELFRLHGVELSEIPEIEEFSELTLADLNSSDNLLKKLTPKLIDKAANYFSIRKEWLRSGEPEMYDFRHWDGLGWGDFFEDYKSVYSPDHFHSFSILTTVEKFDKSKDQYQPFILVLKKRRTEIGDKRVYAYMLSTEWDWAWMEDRLRVKALTTVLYKRTYKNIPIYLANEQTFFQISKGFIPPPESLKRISLHFEDYAAVKIGTVQPNEADEWDAIVEHIKQSQIEMAELKEAYESAGIHTEDDKTNSQEKKYNKNDNSESNSQQSQAAKLRHQPTNDLKHECIYYWIENNKKPSQAEIARRFYAQLSTEKQKLLSPSNAVNTLKKSISEYENREKVLQKKKPPTWLVGFEPEK